MSSKKINIKTSFFRKKDLFDALNLVSLTIRLYCNYAISSKICCVSDSFKKCVKCVRSNRNYNLIISLASIKRIYDEQLRLKKEMREAHVKLSCLKRQLNFLENKKKEMILIK